MNFLRISSLQPLPLRHLFSIVAESNLKYDKENRLADSIKNDCSPVQAVYCQWFTIGYYEYWASSICDNRFELPFTNPKFLNIKFYAVYRSASCSERLFTLQLKMSYHRLMDLKDVAEGIKKKQVSFVNLVCLLSELRIAVCTWCVPIYVYYYISYCLV